MPIRWPIVRPLLAGLLLALAWAPAFAQDTPAPQAARSATPPPPVALEEEFLELRVTHNRGSAFHRVMMDRDERPYLELVASLEEWLEMAADCNPETRHCQVLMPTTGKIFWIDGRSGQMGENGSPPRELDPAALVLHEGALWLRYDAWSAWMPMTTAWHKVTYTLEFRPRFPLLSEVKHQRELARSRMQAENQRRARLAALPLTQPEWNGRTELRYQARWDRSPDGKHTRYLAADLGSDLWGGTALVGAHYLDAPAGVEQAKVNFWRYRRLHNQIPNLPEFYLMEVGDTRFNSMTLMSALSLDNGLRVDHKRQSRGAGRFELRDRTQPGTEIDVYRNGFLEESLVAGADGTYELAERLVAGGDSFTLRFYFPDGSTDLETIRIAWDNAAILDAGETDWRTASGETPLGGFAHAGLRYGFHRTFSAGLHVLHLPTHPGSQNAPGLMADLAWRPFYGLTILSDTLASARGMDHGMSADLSAIKANTLRLTGRWLDDSSPLIGLTGQEAIGTRLWRAEHSLRISRISWRSRYSDTSLDRSVDSRLDLNAHRRFTLFGETAVTGLGTARTHSSGTGIIFSPGPEMRADVQRRWQPTGGLWRATFRLQGRWEDPMDATATLDLPDGGSVQWNGVLNWRWKRRFHIGVTGSNDGVGIRLTWLDVLSPQPGPERWDEFGTGTMSGAVYIPPTPGADPQPMPGAVVRVGRHRVVTGEDGRYVVHGIVPDERMYITVENSSLDATMVAATDALAVRFRPGTHLDYSPLLSWTAGVDGFLQRPGGVPQGLAVVALRASDRSVVSEGRVESDGFFLLEGLTSGRFILEITGTDAPPPPLELNLEPGTDWVSNLVWPWPASGN
ncbi:MAG: hypothetical protein OEY97_07245 [Nitrospirota bacterium]|nr:hypothetical protein [Nitrospirota bacterium]